MPGRQEKPPDERRPALIDWPQECRGVPRDFPDAASGASAYV
jgi:hypothetical protein